MPATLISSLLRWVANHLVAFSLLGFVVAGLAVFGVVELPGVGVDPADTRQRHAGDVPRVSAGAGSVAVAPPASADPVPPAGATAAEARSSLRGDGLEHGAASSKTPKLIGGSLPLRASVEAGLPDPGSATGLEGGFRPPVDTGVPAAAVSSRAELIQQARRAYWNGDFEAAEAAYLTALSFYPADADVFGELGNLYQSMGKPAEALDAFYEAGVRLKAAEETEKLNQIIDLLSLEGDPRAELLAR